MKFKITLLCFCIILSASFQHLFAQNITATGRVFNASTSEPLSGATVSVEGSSSSTLTDGTGNFSITVPRGATLLISYVGMTPVRQQVVPGAPVTINMVSENANLNEVVVVGYGTQRVTKVSGAIST